MLPLRDSYRSQTTPYVTYALMAINGLIFLIQMTLNEQQLAQLFYTFGMVPGNLPQERLRQLGLSWEEMENLRDIPLQTYWSFLTNMFLHGSLLHLLGNMWILFIFGDNVEDRMGPTKFIMFYLACGIAANMAHYAFNIGSTVPTIGASGAIAGVMGAYLILFPHAKVLTLVPLGFIITFINLPAYLFLLIWFGLQLISGLQGMMGVDAQGIAWWAHIGGFVAGVGLRYVFALGRRPGRPVPSRCYAYE